MIHMYGDMTCTCIYRGLAKNFDNRFWCWKQAAIILMAFSARHAISQKFCWYNIDDSKHYFTTVTIRADITCTLALLGATLMFTTNANWPLIYKSQINIRQYAWQAFWNQFPKSQKTCSVAYNYVPSQAYNLFIVPSLTWLKAEATIQSTPTKEQGKCCLFHHLIVCCVSFMLCITQPQSDSSLLVPTTPT